MPWHGIYDEREELVFMGMKHFIHLLSSCWEGVVVVEHDPFMPRHRGWCVPSLHGSWGRALCVFSGDGGAGNDFA